ncbi:TIGR01244 family phosphatase [Natronospirillum operosum]|uniref:TIGR01244 family phosphatase n=1 Tax=Natronospirillum operosum TaxID=2759953 RepID=A0A4Z0W4G5_9GAMM|nr:TIGR01244 family sulfur transferase [Natronospirillum operosum]TGG90218.1 TIGR01244 family phosphatase [Natronospirillum operosum]
MKYQALSPRYAVAPQIEPQDVTTIKSDGFSIVICNRPDGEVDGQPSADSIRAACEEAGLTFEFCPMTGPNADPADVARLRELLQGESKIFAYCRTGNRSSVFYQLAQE